MLSVTCLFTGIRYLREAVSDPREGVDIFERVNDVVDAAIHRDFLFVASPAAGPMT